MVFCMIIKVGLAMTWFSAWSQGWPLQWLFLLHDLPDRPSAWFLSRPYYVMIFCMITKVGLTKTWSSEWSPEWALLWHGLLHDYQGSLLWNDLLHDYHWRYCRPHYNVAFFMIINVWMTVFGTVSAWSSGQRSYFERPFERSPNT